MALLFSAVTVTANDQEVEFLVGGIPREYDDLEGRTAFDMFIFVANALNVSADELLQDFLENTVTVSNHEFAVILTDCSTYEKRILLDSIRAIKQSLRENKRHY